MGKKMDIETLVKEQIENMNLDNIVAEQVRKIISEPLRRTIEKYTAERIKELIDIEIQAVLSKPVNTDDGWGKRRIYTTFEELYKQTFAEAINNKYEIQRNIEQWVKNSVSALFKSNADAVLKKVTEELSKVIATTK